MRIIAGKWGGRRINAPTGRDVRPTTDKVREAIFGSLGTIVVGANVLDVFGGSGAFGLEAASRGAARVVIIEKNSRAQRGIRNNIDILHAEPEVQLIRAPYERAMQSLADTIQFNLFFLDPPYASHQYVPAVECIMHNKLAMPGAMFVFESDSELDVGSTDLTVTRRKRYGTVHVTYGVYESRTRT